MKTYYQVLTEAIEYYREDPSRRAVDNGCLYYDEKTGNKCAVGMFLQSPESVDTSVQAIDLIQKCGMGIFKEEVQHLEDWDFWAELQDLHDFDYNWYSFGLSEIGSETYEKLKDTAKRLDEQSQ